MVELGSLVESWNDLKKIIRMKFKKERRNDDLASYHVHLYNFSCSHLTSLIYKPHSSMQIIRTILFVYETTLLVRPNVKPLV